MSERKRPPADSPGYTYDPDYRPKERPKTPRGNAGGWQESFRQAGPYLGLGMQLALTMAAFTGIGYALDHWLETLPWITIGGAAVGMVAVFILIVRIGNDTSGRH